jgi:hypothetical protein
LEILHGRTVAEAIASCQGRDQDAGFDGDREGLGVRDVHRAAFFEFWR